MLFDVSAEEAIYIDNSESILLKLSNEFSEMNISPKITFKILKILLQKRHNT